MTGRRILLVLVGLLGPRAAIGQSAAARLGLVSSSVERIASGTGIQALSGVGWTLDGAIGKGIVTLGIRYLENSLDNDSLAETIDLVEGEALVWVKPLSWAEAAIGPHLRAYTKEGGTERWVLWEIRARGNAPLLGPRIGAYAELWAVLGGSVNAAAPFGGGRGLEGGLRLEFTRLPFGLGRLPLSVRIRYRVERATLDGEARRETLEQLGVAFGVGWR